jgi:hypothetical protein
MPENLKPCTYRRVRLGSLICSVTIRSGDNTTDQTTVETCLNCSVPDMLLQINCIHLSVGKIHKNNGYDDYGLAVDCDAIGFSDPSDYKTKCSINCPKFKAIHLPLENELLLDVELVKPNATDKELRQKILETLYKFNR